MKYLIVLFIAALFQYSWQAAAKIIDLAHGSGYACAVTGNKELHCWGNNESVLNATPSLSNVSQVSAFMSHACALTSGGDVTCWGSNSSGQLNVPEGLTGVRSIAAGHGYSCAATTTQVQCWGDHPKFGDLLKTTFRNIQKIAVETNASLRQGFDHLCLIDDSKVNCFSEHFKASIEPPSDLKPVYDLRVGMAFACGLETSGWRCWGDEYYFSYAFANDRKPLDISSTMRHQYQICSIFKGGWVSCTQQSFGHAPSNVLGFHRVVAGPYDGDACAISSLEGVFCWGNMYQETLKFPISSELQYPKKRIAENSLDDFLGCYSDGVQFVKEFSKWEIYPDGSPVEIVRMKGTYVLLESALDDLIKVLPGEQFVVQSKTEKIWKSSGKISGRNHFLSGRKTSDGTYSFIGPNGSVTEVKKVPCQK